MPVLLMAGDSCLVELYPLGVILFYSYISVIVAGMDILVDLNDFLSSTTVFS